MAYDRYQKRRVQRKWADTVAHLAADTLPTNVMPRRVRIYVQAPPADGLVPAREEFYEYVKPILVAGALDWEVVEGRREGDVRWAVAEGVRKRRRKAGEGEEEETTDAVEMARERGGTREWEGTQGEMVLGRHAWKEYIRGLHEGWLGPVEKPAEEVVEEDVAPVEALTDVLDEEAEKKKQEEKDEEDKKKKLFKPAPYLSVKDYGVSTLSPSIPEELGPVSVIPFPHVLGFLKTPTRVWRYLHKRELADQIGRQTAAFVLATTYRPLDVQTEAVVAAGQQPSDSPTSELTADPSSDGHQARTYEQQRLLANEEAEWHKSVRKRELVEGKEDLWRGPVVLDERIASRMRVFELSREDEQRAAEFALQPREKKSDMDAGEE